MTTVFCVHPHGFNIGNDAIHIALRAMLDDAFGEIVNVISIPATSRFESHGRAGLTPGVVHEINQYADGVIVGGGNLFENAQLDMDTNALKALEPPMMLFSLSRGRIFNRAGNLVDRTDVMPDDRLRALHEASMCSVARDQATFDHLKSIGCEHVVLGGCPTITLGDAAERLPRVTDHDDGVVLLSIRNPSLMNIPLDAQARVRTTVLELASAIEERTGSRPRLLCHDHRDIPFAASFPGFEYVYTGDVYRFLALLQHAKLCVTFRLHAAIPCLAFGTPFVNISYDERAQSAIETIGLEEWNVDLMSGSAVETVRSRLDELDRLPTLAELTRPVRDDLRTVMTRAFTEFKTAVRHHADQNTRDHTAPSPTIITRTATCSTPLTAST